MIVVLKHGVTEQQMRNLIAWFKDQGVDVHVSRGIYQTVLGWWEIPVILTWIC